MTVGVGDFSSRTLLYMNVLHEHWALVLDAALMNLRLGDLKVLHSCSVHCVLCEVHCALDHMILQGPRCFSLCFYGLMTIYRPCISLSSGDKCYYGAVAIEV